MFTLMLELGRNAEKAIKAGMSAYKDQGGNTTPEYLTTVVLQAMNAWTPRYKGVEVLTPSLRILFAKALGGLAFNLAAAEQRKAA